MNHNVHNGVDPIPYDNPKPSGHTRFVCVSDTHSRTDGIQMPYGDVLLHTGDFTELGLPSEVKKFNDWLARRLGGRAPRSPSAGCCCRTGTRRNVARNHRLMDAAVKTQSDRGQSSPGETTSRKVSGQQQEEEEEEEEEEVVVEEEEVDV
ncbi:Metallophosphoesterase MPPED2 [Liparis tanakae]|uniref:Metallophosphoesterase MPPED2 n=1 Tax=Liparis tanakae TaxID=230148 RepID=A0A4Z2FKN9_9TELE|nr:Metallophosphoesterase MPPED2 [Liparis tanakae]